MTNFDLFSTYTSPYLASSAGVERSTTNHSTYPFIMKKATIVELIALLFVTLYLYTSISKLIDYDVTVDQLSLSPLLAPIASFVTVLLPAAEIICSALLFFPRTRRHGLYLSLGLMVMFTAYIIYILIYNDQMPCTCGGIIEYLSWPQHLALNGTLILLNTLAVYLDRRTPKDPTTVLQSSISNLSI